MMKLRIMICVLCFCCVSCRSVPKEIEEGAEVRQILAGNMSFDLKRGEVRYTLPEPALVRVRVGVDGYGGALLRTLVDWEFKEKGAHVAFWDKKDESGLINFSQRKNLTAVITCIPADAPFRKAPRFEVLFPDSPGLTENGAPIVNGDFPVRVKVSEKDQRWLTDSQYEIILYLDEAFLAEAEQGLSPFNYKIKGDRFSEGYHVITVNVVSYTGEAGTVSRLVYFSKGDEDV